MPNLLQTDVQFLCSLPQTIFNGAREDGAKGRTFTARLARLQRAGLIRVKVDEALAGGRPAMAVVTLTDAGRVALAPAIVRASV